ncbi:hypothetical protein H4219_004679 [Mycoemilia scoparia]|uniref:Chitin-binding type-4 domain-containing protein n=1 Tax=Mycoemilia scoparia TaxID=417184 RepID=A0A9W8DRG6_9FUNG|nr:hypothetical protein H4219_004679 [Mycoemilia scoparia]
MTPQYHPPPFIQSEYIQKNNTLANTPIMRRISIISIISVLATLSYGHMGIADPKPRLTGENLRSPINTGGKPLCGVAERGPTQATVKAGSTMTLKFDGSAIHGGGHCQFAVSYNNKDFAVIEDVLKDCFTSSAFGSSGNYKYDIKLPSELPSGDATIAWAWVNAIGNREYYMGCVDVKIEGGGSGGSFSGPELLVVNHPTLGGGKTIPEFGGNPETGLDLFKARPKITVGPNAGSGGGGGGGGAYGKESKDEEKADSGAYSKSGSAGSESSAASNGSGGGGDDGGSYKPKGEEPASTSKPPGDDGQYKPKDAEPGQTSSSSSTVQGETGSYAKRDEEGEERLASGVSVVSMPDLHVEW